MNRELRITIQSCFAMFLLFSFLMFCIYRGIAYDKKIVQVKKYEIIMKNPQGKTFTETFDVQEK